MRRLFTSVLLAAGLVLTAAPTADETDSQIRQKLIRESIAAYSGSCPCPYNTDRAGRSCGKRSAYSRPGGRSPLCYERDVTPAMVKAYRERQTSKPR